MALLPILEFPDVRLRTRAQPVDAFDDALRTLIDDMFETMYASAGIGLAATQVNVHRRLIVVDVSPDRTAQLVLINPEILQAEGREISEEGCLSVPTVYEKVERAERVRVRAMDRQGQPFERELEGVAAVCVQHEIDHLNGKLFVDYLSGLKRERIRRKLVKEQRERSANPAHGTTAATAPASARATARVI